MKIINNNAFDVGQYVIELNVKMQRGDPVDISLDEMPNEIEVVVHSTQDEWLGNVKYTLTAVEEVGVGDDAE